MNSNELVAELEVMGYDRVTASLVVHQLSSELQADLGLIETDLSNAQNIVVLRDEDVDLVKLCADLCATFFAAASVGAWAPAAVASLVVLLYRIRRRSFDVTPLQGAILETIRSGSALTPAQISDDLGIEGVDESVVSQELAKLAEAPRRDRDRIGLVTADTAGRWSALGI
jgi:hypothetical protein